jgi:LCP family protein required for cell wall assembly
MKDKDLEKKLNEIHNTDLSFTQEDRDKVFQKIEGEQRQERSSFFYSFRHRAAPLMAMAVLLTLSVILAYSFIGGGNSQRADHSDKKSAMEQNQTKSVLFLLKNKNERTDLHLLITYSKKKGNINVTTLPRDTYVPFVNAGEKTESKDKLTNVYAYGRGAEAVRKSVSKALDLPIDYHVAVNSDEFAGMLNTIEEIVYNSDESETVVTFDGVQIELVEGPNHLDGEEAVALLTAANTSSRPESTWSEEDRLKLSEAVLKNMLTHMPADSANALLTSADTNEELENIIGELAATKLNALETSSILEELEPVFIDDIYYLQFKEGASKRIKKELTSFD